MYECSVGKFLAPTTSMKILSPFNLHNVLLVENSCLLNSGSIRTPTFSPIRTRPHPSLLDTNPGSAPHVLVYICFINRNNAYTLVISNSNCPESIYFEEVWDGEREIVTKDTPEGTGYQFLSTWHNATPANIVYFNIS